MDLSAVIKWVTFFAGILCAIIIADVISNMIVGFAGITGPVQLLVGFVLYAVLFFVVLYLMEKLLGIEFFGFGRS
jgi:ABC-type transport system involved in cytochrome bd biosynthesis fused ATPase/permease subunit